MKLKELTSYLNDLIPDRGIIDFCPNGLQVEGNSEITTLATAVTASLETIEFAIKIGVDALIVHHGLFWSKDSYVIQGVKKKKLASLLKNGISLFAYHLPLDLHPVFGNNWKAAEDMNWKNLEPFFSVNGIFLGVKGEIPGIPREELKFQLEKYYDHKATVALGGPEQVHKIALVSGGAHKAIVDAAEEGMEAFVSGSFDEPSWHESRERKINFYALGHSATERVGPIALAKHLEKAIGLPCTFIDTPNPF